MMNERKHLVAEARRRAVDGTAKVICNAADVSPDEIAIRCGVSKITAWRWLEGQAPRSASAVRFAELLREILPIAAKNLEQEERVALAKRDEADNYLRAVAKVRVDIAPAAARLAA